MRHYVNVLGADTAHQCLDAALLDEIFICIAQAPLATNLWFGGVR